MFNSKIIFLILVGSTLLTTLVAVKKVSASLQDSPLPRQGINLPTNSPSLTPTVSPPTIPSGPCLITLFGIQYDVTSLARTPGSGFNCGQDMTTIYSAKHGTDVAPMASYLLIKPSPVPPTATVLPTAKPTSFSPVKKDRQEDQETYEYEDDHEEREDEEHQDRYVDDH